MKVTIHEKGIHLNDDQRDYVMKKIEHLKSYGEKVDDESTQVRIDVEQNKVKTSNRHITVQVTMHVPHSVIRAEVSAMAIEEAVDLAEDKLKKQIERYVHRKNRRDQSGKWIPASTLEKISATSHESMGAEFELSKRKMFELAPMHEEEAVEQMELLGHVFYAFRNVDSSRFNVVYRREDGSYGLLDFGEDGLGPSINGVGEQGA